ncbi:MAG: hypothetical protein ACRDKW_16440 [Actinomycetota bacterium]
MTDYASLLRDRTTLTCRCIDRIFVQGYVPRLQSVGQVCTFLHDVKGFAIPSSAAFGKIGDAYVKEIHRYAEAEAIPVVYFTKGQNKEELARGLLEAAPDDGTAKVLLLGIAQEQAFVWRSWKAKGHERAGHPHMEWGRQKGRVNHFYWYLRDPQWGLCFIKTNAYAPYPTWCWLNGHEWAKRQLTRRGVAFRALDNGFWSCEKPEVLQRVCDTLRPGAVKAFFWRWMGILPSPFTADDRRNGYRYELAFRQLEISDTRVFDRPQAARGFFEGMIRDYLDIGRPDRVSITFDRRINRRTPGRFQTRVVTQGVDPQISAAYKSSKIKVYLKEGRALRSEVTVNDTYDFGIGRLVNQTNWSALRSIGQSANSRLCDALAADAAPSPDVVTFQQVTRPSTTSDGLHAPGLRFGAPRVMATLAATCRFAHVFNGFTNHDLREAVSSLLGCDYIARQATYDLRRLRRKGVIARIPDTFRYQLTPFGRQIAVFLTKTYCRVLTPGLALLDPALPPEVAKRSALAQSWRAFDRALDDYLCGRMTAA